MTVVSIPPARLSRGALRDPSPAAARRRAAAPAKARAPRLELVPPLARGRRVRRVARRAMIAAAILAVLAAPFALVLVHVELTANQLRLSTLQSKADEAQVQYEKLRLRVAELESPARVVATAQQLGMVTPTTIHYVTASSGTGDGAMTTVQPQASPGVDGWAIAKRISAGR